MSGVPLQIERLYPTVSYPVSRGTQMISPLIQWDHSQDWFAGEYDAQATQVSAERKIILNIKEDDHKYMAGHVIDGKWKQFNPSPKQSY